MCLQPCMMFVVRGYACILYLSGFFNHMLVHHPPMPDCFTTTSHHIKSFRFLTEDEWPDKLQVCRWILQMTDAEDVCLYVFLQNLSLAGEDRRGNFGKASRGNR